jgi:D-glycero-alpha-D-manno-heptose 1-phosphate guanylyltransferase
MINEVIILAGGLGKRLRSVVNDLPKPMALINNRPFLEYQFDYLISQGIEIAVLSVGYKHEVIRNHFGGKYKSLTLKYALEREPLGTGGGILKAMPFVEGDSVFIVNGDTLFKPNLKELYTFHQKKKADITIALRIVKEAQRYGIVSMNESERIVAFLEKNPQVGVGYINAGIYLMPTNIIQTKIQKEKFSLEKDFFENQIEELKIYGFPTESYFIDIGVPEDYKKAQHEFNAF